MTWLLIAKETLLKNKWLVFLAGFVALFYFAGATIVSCVAYFQPKVTVITIRQTVDKSITKREIITSPDGTTRIMEEIRADIHSIASSDERREPVLPTKGRWSLYTSFHVNSRLLSVGPAYSFGPLSFGAGLSKPMDSQIFERVDNLDPFLFLMFGPF